ncbi:MAG: hypothetical protein ACTSQY_06170 [Candidatus Odinarchaeia archaeon]
MDEENSKFYSEITKTQAEELLTTHIKDKTLIKIILSEFTEPGVQFAYKNFFNGLYVFMVGLMEKLNLIISVDRKHFWISSKNLLELKEE